MIKKKRNFLKITGLSFLMAFLLPYKLLYSATKKMINQNLEAPSLLELIFYPDIYIPLIIFVFMVLVTIFLRKIFYKK